MASNVKYEKRVSDIGFIRATALTRIPHLHKDLEIICLLEGEAVVFVDSMRCVMHAGDLFLAFPNQIHYYQDLTAEKHVGIIFKPDLVPEFSELFQTGIPQIPVVSHAMRDDTIRSLVETLMKTHESDGVAYPAALQRGCLLTLCALLIPQMNVVKTPLGDSESLRAIVAFCSRNFSENLSLAVLEERLHLNRFYISHLFSGRLRLRFNDYINSLRVSEACRYLLNSDYGVTEISSLVGFNTPRTFNRTFIKQMGLSPSEYRKRRQSEPSERIGNGTEDPFAIPPMSSALQTEE